MPRIARHTLVMAMGLLGSCAPGAPPSDPAAHEIPSPAGPGSGEPFLSAAEGVVYLSWLERAEGGGHDLRFATLEAQGWGEARTIASSHRFFVNWADFPSITPGPGGHLWAHWLERGEAGGYDYGIRVTRSEDRGLTWSEPWTPHEDGTPTEHGFVSTMPIGADVGFLWLDGRRFVAGEDGAPGTEEMALYFRTVGADGQPGRETVVDARVCDCCQTDAVVAASGPVAVYRDRSPEEIRDIYVTRWVDGRWTEGTPVHSDGWETGACPVNGPAVAARGSDVAVAWFTAADDEPRVKVAFSNDSAARFDEPIRVDEGNPAGRVDLHMLEDGSVLVSWLERRGGEWADVLVRRVAPSGLASAGVSVSASSSERASGFPRMAGAGDGTVLVAWTDVAGPEPQVRVAHIGLEER